MREFFIQFRSLVGEWAIHFALTILPKPESTAFAEALAPFTPARLDRNERVHSCPIHGIFTAISGGYGSEPESVNCPRTLRSGGYCNAQSRQVHIINAKF